MMPMYEVRVFHPGQAHASHVQRFRSAQEMVNAIPRIFEDHAGCERVEVYAELVRLFSVDCHGVSTPG